MQVSRRIISLVIAIGAVLTLVGWTQPWGTYRLDFAQVRLAELSVSGQAATVLPAGLALIALAASLLTLTSARILGVVLGALTLVLGIAGCWSVIAFMIDPVTATFTQLETASGIATDSVLRAFVLSQQLNFGVYLTLMGVLILILAGLWQVVSAPKWASRRSRYERKQQHDATHSQRPDHAHSTVDAWDDMTAGGDPTA